MKNKMSIILAVVMVIAMLTGCTLSLEGYAAKVGTEKITESEYKFFLKMAKNQIQSSFGDSGIDWATTKIGTQTAGEYAKQMALDSAVEFKIALMKAKEGKITFTKTELTDLTTSIDNYITSLGSTTSMREDNILAQYGVKVAQFKTIYVDFTLAQKFSSDTQGKYKYAEADLKKFYDDRKTAGEKVTVWHILIKTQDANGEDLDAAKKAEAEKKANDILEKVKSDGNFTQLVTENTEDTGSKDTGGSYTISKGQMVPEFEDWAFKAAPGDVGIVKSTYGYHIMKCPSFDEIKGTTLKSEFLQQKFIDDLAKWKKDYTYNVVKNQKVLDAIKVV